MNEKIAINFPLRVLIMDSDANSTIKLSGTLDSLINSFVIGINSLKAVTIKEANKKLDEFLPNIIFIDIISIGIKDSISFIKKIRSSHPTIVFVLYNNKKELEKNSKNIYAGWGKRLESYFTLEKELPQKRFNKSLKNILLQAQVNLYKNAFSESITSSGKGTETKHEDAPLTKYSEEQFEKLEKDVAVILEKIEFVKKYRDDKKTAFVISAFDGIGVETMFQQGIKPALKKYKIEAIRMGKDKKSHKNLIVDDTFKEIQEAFIVIADLTYSRSNCYLELGYAMGLKKEIIRVARADTKLPFNISGYYVHLYKDANVLKEMVIQSLKEYFEETPL